MSTIITLVRAENRSLSHHLARQLGGRLARTAVVVSVVIAAIVLNTLMATVLGQIFEGTRDTLTDAGASTEASTHALRRAAAVLPFAVALGAAAAVLLLHLVMPAGSPLLLHARIAGASRWSCGAARYLGQLLWGFTLGLGLLVGGAWALSANLSERPLPAMFGMLLLSAVVAATATTLLTATQAVLQPLLRSYESTRSIGLLSICAGIGLVFTDVMRGASGPSVVGGISRLWGGLLPDSALAHGVLLLMLLVAVSLGLVAARSDASGGILVSRGRAMSLPVTRYPKADLVARELVQVLRDPAMRVAMITSLVVAAMLAAGVHLVELHPGIAVMVIVLLAALGAETVHGRSRETAWTLRLAGLRPRTIVLLRTLPYLGLQTVFLLIFLAPVAVPFGGPLAWAEAVSLFALTFAVALLAGSLVPYDRQTPTAVGATSVLTLSLEVLALVGVTWVLRLQGWALILVDLGLAALFFAISVRLMTRGLIKGS